MIDDRFYRGVKKPVTEYSEVMLVVTGEDGEEIGIGRYMCKVRICLRGTAVQLIDVQGRVRATVPGNTQAMPLQGQAFLIIKMQSDLVRSFLRE